MRKLRMLDLFSGIGGMSYALRSCCKTVAFCERDLACRECLLSNMSKGLLDAAPIHEDVERLRAADLPRGIEVVCAGFPCQDLSAAGKHAGLAGERSGLFWQIVRLLRDMDSVKYVLLENVPAILPEGARSVTDALRKLGFLSAHGVFQANEVGAPHTRKRWFCLSVRKGAREQVARPPARASREPVRLIKRPVADTNGVRYKMLGNSVVPQAVALAWNTLLQVRFRPQHDTSAGTGTMYVQHVDGKEVLVTRDVKLTQLKTPLRLPFGITKYVWATPTAQFNHPFHFFNTARGLDNLFNQVFYESSARPAMSRTELIKSHTVNPKFVEWLMGYPPDYTAKE
jgi:C-5 cytosine-specific DNA methylase